MKLVRANEWMTAIDRLYYRGGCCGRFYCIWYFSMVPFLIAGKLQGLHLYSRKAQLMNNQIIGLYQYYQSLHAF